MTAPRHRVPAGVAQAEGMSGVLMFRAPSPIAQPKPISVEFYGNVSLVQIAEIAAGLGQDGRNVRLEWIRDARGVIEGCEIVEAFR